MDKNEYTSDLAPFSEQLDRFKRLIASGGLPHVILLEGHEGIGKRNICREVAAMFYCETQAACGNCDPCKEVKADRCTDLHWLETDEKSLKMDDALAVQNFLGFRPLAAVRLAVMVDIDKFTTQALNRLLKTLEEPSSFTRILMTTSHPQSLLDTILSRVVRWKVSLPKSLQPNMDDRLEKDALVSLRRVLESGDLGEASAFMDAWGFNAQEILVYLEVLLNDMYKRHLEGQTSVELSKVFRRRAQIHEMKQLCHFKNIPLNGRLALESVI